MKKWLLTPMLALLLAGCQDESAKEPVENAEVQQEESTSFPLTVTDALGNEVTLEEDPGRIVSLVPSNTEILFAVGAGDEVVGVGDADNYPEEVKSIDKIGGLELNVEKIISLTPDLVIAHEMVAGTFEGALEQLRNAGITVYTVNDAISIRDVQDTIIDIGKLTAEEENAKEVVSNMNVKIENLRVKTASVETKKSVYVEIDSSPFSVGSGTLMDNMLKEINATNVLGDQEGWIQVDPESIVSLNPEVILSTYGEESVAQIKDRNGWNTVTAVETNQVAAIDGDIATRPGPRLVDALELFAKAIYPDAFQE
ncbi:ABC transporter substrate-binding protein [Mangrovibacillus cuniculi]|uniref:ABC transporter substrate-binding protein n=1 Tax=Mangrovibacillus cuniculi TaxID=2593652 RepID=A0A7S8C9D7_9BACI|nr:ABC transporter substrate-binding protein [Mangrovibacillus cuniculi]QPC45825.1 ABC transporter substrate-binding protein [Mangrovibacillus cuniculi]